MAIYLKDLLENPKLLDGPCPNLRCAKCGADVAEDDPECLDCYYARMGDEIEKHPIVSGGIRRG